MPWCVRILTPLNFWYVKEQKLNKYMNEIALFAESERLLCKCQISLSSKELSCF